MRKKREVLHLILTGDKEWVGHDSTKLKALGFPGHVSTSTARQNIYVSKILLSR